MRHSTSSLDVRRSIEEVEGSEMCALGLEDRCYENQKILFDHFKMLHYLAFSLLIVAQLLRHKCSMTLCFL
jgi:hypothetical protein